MRRRSGPARRELHASGFWIAGSAGHQVRTRARGARRATKAALDRSPGPATTTFAGGLRPAHPATELRSDFGPRP
jgi:hypothetical protein